MPTAISPSYVAPTSNYPAANVHNLNEINVFFPKKKKRRHHFYPWFGCGTSTGIILVLFILLVIVLRSKHRHHC
ncbi:hypothetical protein [Paenibacillus oleatilyticus]|uniref:Sporulation protein YjcZ n=1 Tax=Paenibacillus oleatilyticus TaxID=2594886 RepID=A0ABV4V558_9BACL